MDPKLRELRPEFRAKIELILFELERLEYQPKISNALRTKAQQLEKVKLGYAMPGATDPGFHGWGLACDIIDRRWGWKLTVENAHFFAALCTLAYSYDLECGGTWFGKGGTRSKPTHPSPWNRWGLGWDVCHIQWTGAPKELKKTYTPEDVHGKVEK